MPENPYEYTGPADPKPKPKNKWIIAGCAGACRFRNPSFNGTYALAGMDQPTNNFPGICFMGLAV